MRKIFGVLLLLLSLALTVSLIGLIMRVVSIINIFSSQNSGFPAVVVITQFIVLFLVAVLACAFGFLGVKLIWKAKPAVVHIAADEDFPSRLSTFKKDH